MMKKDQVQLKIYSAVKGAEDWEQITELPFCSDEYAVAHPALSDDGLSTRIFLRYARRIWWNGFVYRQPERRDLD